jgi:hypothetical protein
VAAPAPPPDLERPDSRLAITPPSPPQPEDATPSPEAPAHKEAIQAHPPNVDPSDPRNLPESTLAEMRAKRTATHEYLNARTHPIIQQRFDEGLFDHMSDDPQWKPGNGDWDLQTLSAFRAGPKGWDRTSISRDQYPEVYVYYDETLRLDKLVRVTEEHVAPESSTTPR